MRRTQVLLATALLAVFAIGLPGGVATANDTGGVAIRSQPSITARVVHGTGTAVPDAQLVADFELYASLYPDEAVPDTRLLAAQDQFSDVVAELETVYVDTFVGSALGEISGADAWVAFTDEPSGDVFSLLQDLPIDVEVRWGYAASSVEREEALDFAFTAAGDALGSGVPIVSQATAESIVIIYGGDAPASNVEGIEQEAAVAAASVSSDRLAPLPIEIEFDANLSTEPTGNVFGGGQLRLGGAPECTSGFSGTRNGEEVLITARHCDNLLRFGLNVGWIQYGGTGVTTPGGNQVDLQWHRELSAGEIQPWYRATSTDDLRVVSGQQGPQVGNGYCTWGMVTHFTCAQVRYVGQCIQYVGQPRYCGVAFTDRANIINGDSGGPWFVSDRAVGVTSGIAFLSTGNVSVFTSSTMASRYMSTTIQTGR